LVPDEESRNLRWATGFIMFAGVVMMVAWVWHARRVGALVNDEVYVATPDTSSFDLTGWGWIHILLGTLMR
jgi:hypothetical protein